MTHHRARRWAEAVLVGRRRHQRLLRLGFNTLVTAGALVPVLGVVHIPGTAGVRGNTGPGRPAAIGTSTTPISPRWPRARAARTSRRCRTGRPAHMFIVSSSSCCDYCDDTTREAWRPGSLGVHIGVIVLKARSSARTGVPLSRHARHPRGHLDRVHLVRRPRRCSGLWIALPLLVLIRRLLHELKLPATSVGLAALLLGTRSRDRRVHVAPT